jgi:hypothetical protein
VSNWIDSGGGAPRPWADEGWDSRCPESRHGRGWRWRTPLIVAFAVVLLGLASQVGHARDRAQFANANPELRAWFNALKSGKGPCCSDADGSAISDADWQSGNGHYGVRIDGEWVNVPDEASSPSRIVSAEPWFGRYGTAWAGSISAASCPAA